MSLFYLLSQSTPQVEGGSEPLLINIIIFLALVMVVGLFGWIVREIGKLKDHIDSNQSKMYERIESANSETTSKFERFRAQLAEHDSFREVITLKLEHISQHLPDYALVFRKFTEIDDKITEQNKKIKKYDHEIDRLTSRIDEVKEKATKK